MTPASLGVTLGRRMSSAASATASMGSFLFCAVIPLVAQQLVDRGLGARAFIDALDDDGASEARARAAVAQRAARQAARHHDGICGHAALEDLAAVAIDDLGGGADEGAHGEHRALFDDDALDDFAARADEAIILDDHRLGLQRLEHAADADAAG